MTCYMYLIYICRCSKNETKFKILFDNQEESKMDSSIENNDYESEFDYVRIILVMIRLLNFVYNYTRMICRVRYLLRLFGLVCLT